jgi:alpha/beta superfamily hydrolase
MLHVPQNNNAEIPIVCLFHGYTGNKIESHFIFVKLSRLLEKAGIASVRFDFGGSGESDGGFYDMTISKELEDAKAILEYVKTLDFVDLERISIVGFSMGGVIGSILAGDCMDEIKSLCLWAPARNIKQIYLARDIDTCDLTEISEKEKKDVFEQGYRDISGLPLSIEFIKDLESLDLVGRATIYKKDVLILHGGEDRLVPLFNSENYLKEYGSSARLHVVKGADHNFSCVPWEKELMDHTVSFFTTGL